MRIFARANYPFVASRRIAYVISVALVLAGLAAMVGNGTTGRGWLKYGVDFTGGVMLQVRSDAPRSVEQVRAAMQGTAGSEITRLGEEPEFLIRGPLIEGIEAERGAKEIVGALRAAFPSDRIEVVRSDVVGPRVGAELQNKAVLAIGLSFLLTLVYLAFRFEPRFGVAAILATLHDVVITVGFLSAFRIEVGTATVASLLTVVGYSLNDTIVVFDRIRERLRRTHGRPHQDEAELVNRAINETLPRTVLTSGTTIAVLVPLYLLGGVVLRDFALVLLLGIVVGTYSSIFVASPALLALRSVLPQGAMTRPEPARQPGPVRPSVTRQSGVRPTRRRTA